MAFTRSKKTPKKVHTRTRKPLLAGSKPAARAQPAKKRKATSPVEPQSGTDEELIDAANGLVDNVGRVAGSLQKPKTDFWDKHHGNVAVVIKNVASFDASKYQKVDEPMTTTPFKKVRFDNHVEEIRRSREMDKILTRAIFDGSDDEESDADGGELSEDELSEPFPRMTRSRAQTQEKETGFSVVINKPPVYEMPAAASATRVTRHASTTRHQFRLAVTGNPAAVPAPALRGTADGLSIRASIHSRIDEKYAISRNRTAAAAVVNRAATTVVSKAKKLSTFTSSAFGKATLVTKKRSSPRFAAKASKAVIVDQMLDDGEEEAENSQQSEEESGGSGEDSEEEGSDDDDE